MLKLKEIPEKIKALLDYLKQLAQRPYSELSKVEKNINNGIKIIKLLIDRYDVDDLGSKASALTYSTILSLVPVLAILFSIAAGFGFDNIIESQLFGYFVGQKEALTHVLGFVNSYLEQSKSGGVFVGVGIVLLLYTVLNLTIGIENNFNDIWRVTKGRPYYRKISDYISVVLLLPVFLVFTSGLSIFISTAINTIDKYNLITPIYDLLLKVVPFVVSISSFMLLYKFMPYTKVKWLNALYGGIFAGIAFLTFQYLYINGQIWVSKYNAIYGSFAFLPLLMLWIQLSWLICLIGAEISYVTQNYRSYDYMKEISKISRRYEDFILLVIATMVIKRFEKGEKPYNADEISDSENIPIRLTQNALLELEEMKIINQVNIGEETETYYQPAMDINKITVGFLLEKIDRAGSESFVRGKEIEFKKEWQAILKSRSELESKNNKLLKDL